MAFKNHSPYETDEKQQILNLRRVLMYLLFSMNLENYSLVSEFLHDKAWMILMVASWREEYSIRLIQIQDEIQRA